MARPISAAFTARILALPTFFAEPAAEFTEFPYLEARQQQMVSQWRIVHLRTFERAPS